MAKKKKKKKLTPNQIAYKKELANTKRRLAQLRKEGLTADVDLSMPNRVTQSRLREIRQLNMKQLRAIAYRADVSPETTAGVSDVAPTPFDITQEIRTIISGLPDGLEETKQACYDCLNAVVSSFSNEIEVQNYLSGKQSQISELVARSNYYREHGSLGRANDSAMEIIKVLSTSLEMAVGFYAGANDI